MWKWLKIQSRKPVLHNVQPKALKAKQKVSLHCTFCCYKRTPNILTKCNQIFLLSFQIWFPYGEKQSCFHHCNGFLDDYGGAPGRSSGVQPVIIEPMFRTGFVLHTTTRFVLWEAKRTSPMLMWICDEHKLWSVAKLVWTS